VILATVKVSLPVAAVIAAAASLLTLWVSGIRADRSRRRELYAKSLEAALAYREFPYVIRRRNHTDLAAERVRISEALREVQRDLALCESMLRMERHAKVYVEYKHLVAKTRVIAGGYMRDEWDSPPITTDGQVSVPGGFDYRGLAEQEKAFTDATAEALRWWKL
jgi:hypothetical protein